MFELPVTSFYSAAVPKSLPSRRPAVKLHEVADCGINVCVVRVCVSNIPPMYVLIMSLSPAAANRKTWNTTLAKGSTEDGATPKSSVLFRSQSQVSVSVGHGLDLTFVPAQNAFLCIFPPFHFPLLSLPSRYRNHTHSRPGASTPTKLKAG